MIIKRINKSLSPSFYFLPEKQRLEASAAVEVAESLVGIHTGLVEA